MTRVSYLLFLLVISLLVISLFLYKRSWQKSHDFNERVNVVNNVLLLLERLEDITSNNIIYESLHSDSIDHVTASKNAEVDTILNTLHRIVLYEDQRSRIDTIWNYIKQDSIKFADPQSVLAKDSSISTQYKTMSVVIRRAKHYAQWRLRQHKDRFEQEIHAMNNWVNGMLLFSFLLMALGIYTTTIQYISKNKLKLLHESILEHASIGICVYEAKRAGFGETKFTLTYANEGAIFFDSRDKDRISLITLRGEKTELLSRFNEVLKSGVSQSLEFSYTLNDKLIWYIANISRVSSKTVAIYFQDITQLKTYEEELNKKVVQLEKVNADLEQFARATSHDLQEPFRKINIMADMVRQNHNATNNNKYLDSIIRSASRGIQLIKQILNYSRVELNEVDFVEVDLSKVVVEIQEELELVIREKNAKINVAILPVINANYIQMVQLFMNIINNSLKFSMEGRNPVIDLTCELLTIDSPKRTDQLSPLYEYYLICIADNGIGFDSSYKEKIFNAFERLYTVSQFPGFGLGLSLCKKIVLNHNGYIEAVSEKGVGSKFFIYIPKRQK